MQEKTIFNSANTLVVQLTQYYYYLRQQLFISEMINFIPFGKY